MVAAQSVNMMPLNTAPNTTILLMPPLLVAAPFFEVVGEAALPVPDAVPELLELPPLLPLLLLPEVFEPGVLLSLFGSCLRARPEITLPFASYTVSLTCVLVIATSLPLFGLGMPLSINAWPPLGTLGTEKSVVKLPDVMSEGSQVGGCKDDAVAFPDSSNVTFSVAY